MANTDIGWVKLFFGFGILVVISGIYFIFQKEYVEGLSGVIIGAFLIVINMKAIKGKDRE